MIDSKRRLFAAGLAGVLTLPACRTAPPGAAGALARAPSDVALSPPSAVVAPTPVPAPAPSPTPSPVPKPPRPTPRIALVLGGGAARGFAHIGVIKVLEEQGIVPDMVVGTSAGALVATLYAAGKSGFELQRLAIEMDEGQISDWSLPDRGLMKGEALQKFVNQAVGDRPLDKLGRQVAVVATDLNTGEPVMFRSGDAGMAVRASSSVPGVFQPVTIGGRQFVDGGLVSPVPVRIARSLGATFVIASDISARPGNGKTQSTLDVLLQTFTIMIQALNRRELPEADVVIRPDTAGLGATDFKDRHLAVLEGERAAVAAIPDIKAKLARLREGR